MLHTLGDLSLNDGLGALLCDGWRDDTGDDRGVLGWSLESREVAFVMLRCQMSAVVSLSGTNRVS